MKATELRPRNSSTLFRIPKSDENICCFQISAATTGISRNGVISSVRTSPCPKNLRSSRTANSVPKNERQNDGEHGHLDARPHRLAEERVVEDRPVVVDPDELRRLGNQRLRLVLEVGEAVVDADQERQLRDQDREEQRREQRQPPTPRRRRTDLATLAFARLACRSRGVGGCHVPAYLIALRRDALALAERVGVLRRSGDHAREELGAPVADVLELRDADVLHAR